MSYPAVIGRTFPQILLSLGKLAERRLGRAPALPNAVLFPNLALALALLRTRSAYASDTAALQYSLVGLARICLAPWTSLMGLAFLTRCDAVAGNIEK